MMNIFRACFPCLKKQARFFLIQIVRNTLQLGRKKNYNKRGR